MSVDTFLVIPVADPARAARLLSEAGDQVSHIGGDYVVLYKGNLFAEVEGAPEAWGPRYVQDLPPPLRRKLDPRGLLARPEVGQSFEARTYAEAVESPPPPLWLPVRAPRRKRREKRLLLVALSPKRQAMLLDEPELVSELIASRTTQAIPGLIEFDEIWIDLQRLLYDCLWLERSDDERADALAPRRGLSLVADKDIDSACLIETARARSIAIWLETVTPAVVQRALREPPSRASRSFPESLGAAEADDHSRARSAASRAQRKPRGAELDEALKRLLAFYGDVRRTERSVLSVRFRD